MDVATFPLIVVYAVINIVEDRYIKEDSHQQPVRVVGLEP
jgi:hypothetical protein